MNKEGRSQIKGKLHISSRYIFALYPVKRYVTKLGQG